MAENVILNNVATFTNDTAAVNTVNGNSATITTAFADCLSRAGVSPNQMTSNLDMNSNQIINLPIPATTNSPARLIDVVSNPNIVVPPTGTSGATVPFLNGNNTWSGTNTFTNTVTIPSLPLLNTNNTWTGTNTFNNTCTFNNPVSIAFTQTGTGAVARTVDSKIKDYALTVVDFGADPTGVADSTTAIQNAINAAQSGSKKLFINPGTFKITTALSITAGITLEGAGVTQSIIQPATNISGININSGSSSISVNAVTFRDFAISYASAAVNTTSGIIFGASVTSNINQGSVFDRLLLNNCGNGFNVGQSASWVIRDCYLTNITTGGSAIVMDNSGFTNPDSGDSTITGCTFILTGTNTGITISSFAGLRVVNNKFISSATGSNGLVLNLKNGILSSLLIIMGNSFEGMTNNIILQRAGTTGSFANVIISSNEFEAGSGGAAILNPTDANGRWLTNVNINSNIVFGPTSGTNFAFVVKAAEGFMITDNVVISNNSSGSMQKVATAGSDFGVVGPNGSGGGGTYTASDLTATNITTFNPT